jgi:hypothetical protein
MFVKLHDWYLKVLHTSFVLYPTSLSFTVTLLSGAPSYVVDNY